MQPYVSVIGFRKPNPEGRGYEWKPLL